ncbi:MAG: DUF1643 domain-containing protein [Rhizonema sp. NSF051]|nr:DUF1643 domain-containing protein [Rhizonema sp. NSF051]
MKKTAVINGNYRYLLGREWNVNKQQVIFVMLNPSTADASKDDQTIQNTNVTAEYQNGILNLTLPKITEEKNKVVKVNLVQE